MAPVFKSFNASFGNFCDSSVSSVIKAFCDALLIMNVVLILSMVTTIISIGILVAAKEVHNGFLKNWIFSVCLTLILAVIFSVMTPKGSLGKFYKMIISMFIFVSFLYPVSNAKASDFKIDLPMFNNNYEQQIEDAGKIIQRQL